MERAQEDGEDDGGTLASSTPRSKNTRSPKETPSSSEKVSDFFYGKKNSLCQATLSFKQQLPINMFQ